MLSISVKSNDLFSLLENKSLVALLVSVPFLFFVTIVTVVVCTDF